MFITVIFKKCTNPVSRVNCRFFYLCSQLAHSVSFRRLSVFYLYISLVLVQLCHLLKLPVHAVLTLIDISLKKPTILFLHSLRLSQASPCPRLSAEKTYHKQQRACSRSKGVVSGLGIYCFQRVWTRTGLFVKAKLRLALGLTGQRQVFFCLHEVLL